MYRTHLVRLADYVMHCAACWCMHNLVWLALLVTMTTIAVPVGTCSEPNASSQPSTEVAPYIPKFELDVQPILTARGCNSGPCHGKSRGQNGFALSLLGFDANMDYESIVEGARGRRLSAASPESSLFLQKATGQISHGGGIKLELGSEDYECLKSWIQSGTPRALPTDPVLTHLTLSPEPHSMQAGQEESLQITAHYSDSSTRDVTRTCAYQSNEPTVVSVSREGKLKAGQLPGEATIMARYMGRIVTWSTAVPRPQSVAPEAVAALPRNNPIDELVYQKLARLNMLPSAPCNDEKFMRRVYIDAIGRLPTPDEVREYSKDTAPDKRARLVDALLERPEYADFWANKWADLLRPNPYRVGIKATMSLDVFLRDAFRHNVPYDQFVREIVTAHGSNWKNGAVTVFRDRREPAEITTMVSQLFLGVRLECAKCHQHPFEVYGQRDFYSLAAYFSRVGYKGTGLSPPISGGEEIVFTKSSGEVRHPITGEVLPPKPLFGEPIAYSPDSDPRLQLADWMTSPDNPFFARVAANRIWSEVMGIGLVDPVDDLRATNPASNPELLTWLANHFRETGFDNKKLLRSIFASQTYALDSMPNQTNAADYRNYSRHFRKRLRAEVLSDAISDVLEQPEEFAGMPPGTRATQLWTHRIESELLDAFGRPDPNQDPPCERTPDTTMGQALHMMNGPRIQSRLSRDGGRCERLAKSELPATAIIEELYLAAFSRFPTSAESISLVTEFDKPNTSKRQLIEDILWSMINSPEFLFND